jgi:hypothetical protein
VVIQKVHHVGDLHSRLLQATFQNPVVSLGIIQLAGQFLDLPLETALASGVHSEQLLDVFARVPDADVLLFQNLLRLELVSALDFQKLVLRSDARSRGRVRSVQLLFHPRVTRDHFLEDGHGTETRCAKFSGPNSVRMLAISRLMPMLFRTGSSSSAGSGVTREAKRKL